jgi:hypothetical protein
VRTPTTTYFTLGDARLYLRARSDARWGLLDVLREGGELYALDDEGVAYVTAHNGLAVYDATGVGPTLVEGVDNLSGHAVDGGWTTELGVAYEPGYSTIEVRAWEQLVVHRIDLADDIATPEVAHLDFPGGTVPSALRTLTLDGGALYIEADGRTFVLAP